SWVWNYVEKIGDNSFCKVVGCQKPNRSASTSTIAKHLANEHKIFKPDDNPKIIEHLDIITPSAKLSEDDQKEFNRLFSLAIGVSTTPYIFCENPFLIQALKILNPHVKVPVRQTVRKICIDENMSISSQIREQLDSSKWISICIDFWSRKTSGFYGLSVHLLDQKESAIKSFLLCLEHVPHPHTADIILDKTECVLRQWGFDGVHDARSAGITPENGSTMFK
ncbi:MAG: hypothetical protein MHPSP_004807, partial [Paramarteilia canceri]